MITAEEQARFWAKVAKGRPGCWNWTASTGSHGYGQMGAGGTVKLAHRIAWELTNGPIPAGLTVDHLCLNRLCQRPDHLQLVTRAENVRRAWRAGIYDGRRATQKSCCLRGHAFTAANTYHHPRGYRVCKTCRAASRRKHAAARKGQAA